MEMIDRYCGESYAQKQDIMKEFGNPIGNVVWDEIELYRKQFIYVIPDMLYHVVMCRNVLFKISDTEKKLYQITRHVQTQVENKKQPIWDMLQHQKENIEERNYKEWIQMACTLLHIQSVKEVESLFSLDVPFTLVAFISMYLCSNRSKDILYLYLMKENLLHTYQYFPDFNSMDEEIIVQKDITYQFLRFLNQIQLKICEGMVLLNSNKKQTYASLSFEELKECYPQLREEQIHFYLTHRKQNHYYDIQQYLLFANVCYETGRSSMDKLVDMGWYRKRKMGKKFVYYIGI